MMAWNRRLCSTLCAITAVLAGTAAVLAHGWKPSSRHEQKPPLLLTVREPRGTGHDGALQNSRWPLILRLTARSAPALVEAAETEGRREALVLEDPDGCIDMRDFPLETPGTPYEPCAGPDETFLEFTSERFDSFDLDDENTGNYQVRERLVDDPYVEGELLNKPYLRNRDGDIEVVDRPQTGGGRLDGYGYGVDDDLPGLVIMADIGGARIFTPGFDRVPGVIRNLAGFVNNVAVELLSASDGTSIVASMHVLAGVFEPIAQFDLDVDDSEVDYLRRIESGRIKGLCFDEPPADDDELLRALVDSYSPIEFVLRAVVVEGVGPEFIHDVDRNGRYTARDLKRMGYTLLSNQVTLHIREVFDVDITDTPEGRTCPPRTLLFADLDGNGEDGRISCSGSGGALRLRRVPR